MTSVGEAVPEPAGEPPAELPPSRPSRRVLRLVGRLILASSGLGLVGIVAEAVVRARIVPPESRVRTALYTRAVPWGGGGDRRDPIALGTLDGSPLEARIPVALHELPDHLVQAVLAVEDRRFYGHHGLDLRRIGGALVANVRAGAVVQGGSTLTQQLAKNLFLSAGRTPLRKLRETALALALELRYSKATILEAYLNEIYLGQDGDRAIHGVGAAARYYFGKPAGKLSLGESALLAGMISAPNRNAPDRHPDAAADRRDLVLQLMAEQRRISRSTAERASRARVASRTHSMASVDGRYFRDFVTGSVSGKLPARGAAVYTTLDATLQRAAERAVRTQLDRMRTPGAEAALVAIDPGTGEVLAMVGGHDYGASQFNRATDAHRQPGSAFKPVVALAALEPSGGASPAFTLASVIQDEPLRVRTPRGPWEPANYDRAFRGPVTFREAMEQSLNVPFARIGLAVGPERIVTAARRLGITSPLAAVPSLALGSSEVTLMELVRAYGVFAAGGKLASPRTVLGHGRYGGEVEDDGAVSGTQAVDPAVAYLVTSTLEGVVARGTGRALNEDGRWEGIAGKTGTSSDWRDAWFVVYSKSLVVGVWVGFDDGRSLRMTGSSAALPIAAAFLAQAASEVGREPFDVPEGITEAYVASADGSEISACGQREVFLAGTEPPDGGCSSFQLGDWQGFRQWGGALERRARRFLEDLIADRLEQRRQRR
jgi:1A family penicillin-binding protein